MTYSIHVYRLCYAVMLYKYLVAGAIVCLGQGEPANGSAERAVLGHDTTAHWRPPLRLSRTSPSISQPRVKHCIILRKAKQLSL